MFSRFAIGRPTVSRISRKLVAMLIVASYLFAGALHSVCDTDVTSGPTTKLFTSVKKDAGQPDKAALVSNHCHGCFSVSVPSHLASARDVEPGNESVFPGIAIRSGLSPGIEPPPPKFLT